MSTEQEKKGVRNAHAPILFVDDEPMAHKIVKNLLKDWDVKSAYSAEEAQEIMNKENILILITDIKMPGMTGIDLLKKIKRTPGRGIVQVIVVTASEQIEHLINALESGANDFLLKPLKKEDIEETLENTLSKITRWQKTMKSLFQKRKENVSKS
ncbi:MAG: response regulator [Desulfobacterales bacterium]|nr:response regulator [Desulfobacterales bacterium]MBF0397295.1 response regulator [Desulfobacterales bacterium]